jgi:hypothetical protein
VVKKVGKMISHSESKRLLEGKMKFEYLQVYFTESASYVAFDGNSVCDGDTSIVRLLNKLGQDRWEYCGFTVIGHPSVYENGYHLLKRSLP